MVVSAVGVALTVSVPRVSLADTVRRPISLMVVPLCFPTWSIDHVTFWDGLFEPVTVALKDRVLPLATLAVVGLTVTLATVAVGAATVTVAVPYLVVSAVDVALTVSVPRVSLADTVRRPLELMDVPLCLFVWTIDHVTVWGGLLVPETVMEKDCVLPLATLAVAGLTVTLVIVAFGDVPDVSGSGSVLGDLHPAITRQNRAIVIMTPEKITRLFIESS